MRLKEDKFSSKAIATLAAEVAEAKKAADIEIFDIHKVSPIADYFVICSTESTPQIKAIADAIVEKVKKRMKKVMREGEVASNWIVLDLGSVIVHIMGTKERSYYNLEELWGAHAIIYHL